VKLDARAPGFTIADAVLFEEQPAAGVRTAPKRPPRRAFRNGSCDLLGRVKPF
jgi:hypothetical protein